MEASIERARDRAQRVVVAAAGRASVRARSAVGIVAHESHTLASALRTAADQAQHDGSRMVHEPLRKIADLCEQIAMRAVRSGAADLPRPYHRDGHGAPAAAQVASPMADREVAITASTTGGMSEAQAETSGAPSSSGSTE